MFESLKESWEIIRDDPPGERFRRQYERRHQEKNSILKKVLLIGLGILIVLAGIFFLPAPGPGMFIIFIGLGLISQESLWLAILLDKSEVYLRSMIEWMLNIWDATSFILKIVITFILIAIIGLSVYGLYWTLVA